jgi:GTPase SAR1 family protein
METIHKISPQIAIVGTEGSGKTILASVLAKRMSSNTENIFLHPRDWQTAEYVEKVWTSLNSGEWWKSTEAGCAFELQWTFHIGRLALPMKLIDSAGQDLRELFSKDTYKKENLTGIHRELLDYIQTASVIILVVNLLHFRGEPDAIKRKQNEFVLKEVIDMFATDAKSQDIAVVFTAWDLYYADITKNYGNFTKYLQKELPLLYNAMRLGQQSGDLISCFPVAAVMDTELKNNIRVPKSNFRSGGLDTVSNWLINIVQREHHKEHTKKQAKDYEIKMQQLNQWLIPAIGGVVVGMSAFLISSGNFFIAIGGLIAGAGLSILGMTLLDKHYEANTKETKENKETNENKRRKIPEPPRKQNRNYTNIDSPTITTDDENVNEIKTEYENEIATEPTQPSERKSKSIQF